MLDRAAIGGMGLALALGLASVEAWSFKAWAFDDAQYPDWKGAWVRIGNAGFDPTKANGLPQQPPLTEEYRAIWEANMAAAAAGDQNYNPQARCLPGGMPRMMIAFEPMEIIVRPDVTYLHLSYLNSFRRVYTDGRAWPAQPRPTLNGYSIGQWVDEDRDGRFDALLIETRGFGGPRHFDSSGIPTHQDNQTVIKEQVRLDKANQNVLVIELKVSDNALSRPWSVTRKYRRDRNAVWIEHNCAESQQVYVGKDTYFLSADGHLMPTRKEQLPPDLRYFKKSGN